MAILSNSFIGMVLVLFIVSLIRMLTTPHSSAVRNERTDMTLLMLMILTGTLGSQARDRFAPGSKPYWLANLVLIPICLISVLLIWRLYTTYKHGPKPPKKTNTRLLKPPKLDPPGPNLDT